jgi:cyclopropane-fatty-acyl-phospholipid synthase
MTYSAALFADDDDTLAIAQGRKYARMADLAGISPHHKVLEIGCGWGGFMDFAARAFDCEITGVSISTQQCRYAEALLARSQYGDRARVEFRDYRDLSGTYDRIVSIEMFEAVGEAYWDTYAQTLKRLLKPAGAAAVQIITIDESRFDTYRSSPDFIQTHVFPGGMLPTRTRLAETFERAGFAITEEHTAGMHYARTLTLWRERFDAAWSAIIELGFDERFRRLWHFYLAYCEAGFRTGATDLVQLRLEHA